MIQPLASKNLPVLIKSTTHEADFALYAEK